MKQMYWILRMLISVGFATMLYCLLAILRPDDLNPTVWFLAAYLGWEYSKRWLTEFK